MIQVNRSLCENVNPVQLSLLAFGCGTVGPNWGGTVPKPTYTRFYYILSGECNIQPIEGQPFEMKAGQCYLLPAGWSFSYFCEEEMEHLYFHVRLTGTDGVDLLSDCRQPLSDSFQPEEGTWFRPFLESGSLLEGLCMRQRLLGKIFALLQQNGVVLEDRRYSAAVRQAIAYIRANPSIQLRVPEIAQYAFSSESTLTKRFRKEVGMSIGEYVDEVVFSEASAMLHQNQFSVQEISERFGFCDPFYFSRRFRERFGMSPREYSKSVRI